MSTLKTRTKTVVTKIIYGMAFYFHNISNKACGLGYDKKANKIVDVPSELCENIPDELTMNYSVLLPAFITAIYDWMKTQQNTEELKRDFFCKNPISIGHDLRIALRTSGLDGGSSEGGDDIPGFEQIPPSTWQYKEMAQQ